MYMCVYIYIVYNLHIYIYMIYTNMIYICREREIVYLNISYIYIYNIDLSQNGSFPTGPR